MFVLVLFGQIGCLFFGGDETVTPPWIDPTAEETEQGRSQFNIYDDLQTGSLADYLGVPTTITGSYGYEHESNKVSYDRLKGVVFSDSISSDPVIANPIFPASQVAGSPDGNLPAFYNRQVDKPLSQIFCNKFLGRSFSWLSKRFFWRSLCLEV